MTQPQDAQTESNPATLPHDNIDRGRDQKVAENSTPNSAAVNEVMSGEAVQNAAAESGETQTPLGESHGEIAIPDRSKQENFVWNQENLRLLLSRELKVDLASVRAKPPYNIWALKTTRQSQAKYERAYVISREGELTEIPTGISIGTYYNEIKAGAVAVEYNGMNGDKPFRTVTMYGGKTLPELATSNEEDDNF